MGNIKPDKEPDKKAVPDRDESIGLMEPMLDAGAVSGKDGLKG
jgi:hypothetical protein